MLALARVFEQTILTVLDEGFQCNVFTIGGIPVEDGAANGLFNRDLRRNLQSLSGVQFHCRVTKPCPTCTDTEATMLGARVFDETFDELDEKAKSGELTVIFCAFAQVGGIITEECTVEIMGVEGTMLEYEYVEDTPMPPTGLLPTPSVTPEPTSKVTPQPTPVPILPEPVTSMPTLKPVMGWLPTPFPTSKPVMETPPPTTKPVTMETAPPTTKPVIETSMPPSVPVPVGTESPTTASLEPVTQAPVVAGEQTKSPTLTPEVPPVTLSPVDGVPVTLAPMTAVSSSLPTMSPNMASVTSSPTLKPVSSTPSVSPTTDTLSSAPTPSPNLTPAATASPTVVATTSSPSLEASSSVPSSTPSSGSSSEVTTVTGPPTGSIVPTPASSLPGTPAGLTTSPTVSALPTVNQGVEPTSSVVPTPASVPSTFAPTSTPPGALYYKGFEKGMFPEDPEWSTEGDGLWALSTEQAKSGVYSIKSPDLSNEELLFKSSNVTLTTGVDWPAGTLYFSILDGVEIPFDDLVYYVDGQFRGPFPTSAAFETQIVQLPPGQHTITFSYMFNPLNVPLLPPESPNRIGAVFIDDVYFLPSGVSLPPTMPNLPGIPTEPTTSPALSATSPALSASPTLVQGEPTSSSALPTPASVPSTIAPTSIPPGALYYDGFEQGDFPDSPEWSTVGDGLWALSTEQVNSGAYSIKSPDLMIPGDVTQKGSNVTLSTNPGWPAGTLVFSILAGANLPYDNLIYYVDDQQRGIDNEMTAFETRQIQLSPGAHTITWSYEFNPLGLPAQGFPPIPVDRIGAVFIDDVYFLPVGITIAPSAPSVSGDPTSSVVPTPVSVPTTTPLATPKVTAAPITDGANNAPSYYPTYNPTGAPQMANSTVTSPPSGGIGAILSGPPTPASGTSNYPDAVFYDGFEQATFPEGPEWTTDGADVWALTTERANSGIYSIKSPDLSNEDLITQSANVTLNLDDPDFEGGSLVLSVLSGTEDPQDELAYFVDGELIGRMVSQFEFETLEIALGPGSHEITFQYQYNQFFLDSLPPPSPNHIGAVFIDDVRVMPFSDTFFDGFETGDFSALDWEFSGEQAWVVDETLPFEGSFSAHVRTEDISTSGNYSQLDLPVTLASAAFIQFHFYAPVSMPFEMFGLLVDDVFLTGLSTEDETWTEAGAILSSGQHTISWRLSKNPSGAPDEMLESMDQPPYRVGEAWLDNVQLLPATPSFIEDWESGDFTAYPWILSGDGNWTITDSVQYVGANSATIASDDIEANSGSSGLSIDIITEQGGLLSFKVLPSVAGPFEIANVLVDGIAVLTYSTTLEEWLAQEISIQPGKRRVTFQLTKNPGNVPEDLISGIPSDTDRQGQIWLDEIVFTAEAPQL